MQSTSLFANESQDVVDQVIVGVANAHRKWFTHSHIAELGGVEQQPLFGGALRGHQNRDAPRFVEATEAAIDEKLAEFDATGKGFAVKDISWAVYGIGIAALGIALNLIDELS